ncbi:acetyl-lysine deacetylase/acetylornithine deacetylase [Aeropyrum pernix K1]|uniref:Putative [LysW]-lysine/[LysW]-ornithine hydrolase n=1 Tax=Aeropyrum pernix (strain ATCC 700893 / DSM 11879 / JCM 9820 / NBRC 100138 / K1) TaxID=272557 RepID=LYSK_AERPE|nr:N-acetyl-lysine deacetylase [Aeropyrum pernix]Q9YBY3.2 RecName: Full=Putative [LysW]-lysine/[LysW]-ornithine hydrolase [Aeropyrum pernix K1]BAA80465.2 acetyl-lysine deacetylase/acetylornithine deacetylase [Aeropyrum pernix K1]
MVSSDAYVEGLAAKLALDLLRVYTPTGSEERLYPVLERWASELGLGFSLDSAGNAVLSAGPDGLPVVGLVGHLDTVPGRLEARLEGYTLWGRGAVDAKGPLAAMILGLHLASSEGLSCSSAVLGLVGEEGDSPGAWSLVSRGDTPLHIIVGEPTGGDGVAIGYRGSLTIEIECTGHEGHSSNPERGAADMLVKALASILERDSRATVTRLKAGTAANITPGRALATVNMRFNEPGLEALQLASELCSSLHQHRCHCSSISLLHPVKTSLSNATARALVASLRTAGVKPRIVVKRGTSDMNVLSIATESIAAYGPGDPRLSHTKHENIRVGDIVKAAMIYSRTLTILCNSL